MKRTPSAPWLGCPVVRGISPAVIATRSVPAVDCALACGGEVTPNAKLTVAADDIFRKWRFFMECSLWRVGDCGRVPGRWPWHDLRAFPRQYLCLCLAPPPLPPAPAPPFP